ncbi:MAG: LacI family transcriptional regulator [Gemmatimonadota bacterium]|nr:LacI family transcriptional regulator [Gemmatimonadota bacterium]
MKPLTSLLQPEKSRMGERPIRGSRSNGNATTIRDVARVAGVSVATVSRVLNGSAPVLEPTRERILEAARELRFTPNASARSLSMRRTAALGVVLPDLHGEFFSELLRGIDRTAQQHGRHLLVSSSHHGARGMSEALRTMHGRVDGLIVMAPDLPAEGIMEALPHTIPTVLVNCAPVKTPGGMRVDALAVDNFGGSVAMVEHLASLGHRRIAFIAGAEHNEDSAERERGYGEAMKRLGLESRAEYRTRGDFTEAGGHSAAAVLMRGEIPPTAIFAANDMMALGAMAAVRESGLRVPEDVAIAGFDDIPTARYVSPTLTTVRVDVEALGALATSVLVRRLSETRSGADAAHDGGESRQIVPSILVVRGSCGSDCARFGTSASTSARKSTSSATDHGAESRASKTPPRTPPGKTNPTAANQEIE